MLPTKHQDCPSSNSSGVVGASRGGIFAKDLQRNSVIGAVIALPLNVSSVMAPIIT